MQQYEQSVFVSYAWDGESEEIVNQIDQALQQRGLKIIRDKRDLGYKGSISAFMERIGQGNCIIVVISDRYLRSPNCMFELVEIAEGKQFHDRVFPIILSSAEIYDPVRRLEYVKHWEIKRGELAQAMKEVDPANLQGIREDMDLYDRIRDKVSGLTSILKDMNTLTPDLHRDSDFSELYAGIERRMAEASGQIKPESGESPYMGLRYFDTPDAALFYGREALTDKLLRRVKSESFLAIVGASGSGKSSVARAGLSPAWKAAMMGTVHVITPTAHPLESLAASLTHESESFSATLQDLQKDTRGLRLRIRRLLNNSGQTNLLLVVDQFEEAFTLCKDPDERKAFIENLLTLADEDAERNAARVIITLRADFYPHCAEYEGLRLGLEKHQAYIGPMTQDELREAITAPAEKNGWDFQSGLVDLILQDIGTEPGALPLLSHALLETWKHRSGQTLTFAGYFAIGRVQGAIAETAETTFFKELNPQQQETAKKIFLRLTEIGQGTGATEATRRRVALSDLVAEPSDEPIVKNVLDILAEKRLITLNKDFSEQASTEMPREGQRGKNEEIFVEVAHEALIREWPTLQTWLRGNQSALRIHRSLTRAAEQWKESKRDKSVLYRGARLSESIEWAKQYGPDMNTLERDFLSASKRVMWLNRALWGIILILVTTVTTLGVTGQLNRFIYRPVDMHDYWVTIPAGTFLMGSSDEEIAKALKLCSGCDFSSEQPQHWVDLLEYQIGKYEITNRQYAQCVKAGFCQQIVGLSNIEAAKALDPLVNVSWDDAKKFCEWVGGRLPTEAEWEKAASWDEKTKTKRTYPWGETIDCSHANYSGQNGCVRDTTSVGSYESGKSPYGLYDMAGNVQEWVNDWYSETYYQSSPSSNPQGPNTGVFRVLRGGTRSIGDYGVRSASRVGNSPWFTSSINGFRCSRDSAP